MQAGKTGTAAREAIGPARLSTGEAPAARAWWEGGAGVATGIGAGVIVLVALGLVVRRSWRRRIGACERAFRRMARRAGLSPRERGVLRAIAAGAGPGGGVTARAEARNTGAPGMPGVVRGRAGGRDGATGGGGVPIEDVVDFREAFKRVPAATAALLRAALPAHAGAGTAQREADEGHWREVKPAVLMLSEHAFARAATAWLRGTGRAERDRERVVAIQRKIFAGR